MTPNDILESAMRTLYNIGYEQGLKTAQAESARHSCAEARQLQDRCFSAAKDCEEYLKQLSLANKEKPDFQMNKELEKKLKDLNSYMNHLNHKDLYLKKLDESQRYSPEVLDVYKSIKDADIRRALNAGKEFSDGQYITFDVEEDTKGIGITHGEPNCVFHALAIVRNGNIIRLMIGHGTEKNRMLYMNTYKKVMTGKHGVYMPKYKMNNIREATALESVLLNASLAEFGYAWNDGKIESGIWPEDALETTD